MEFALTIMDQTIIVIATLLRVNVVLVPSQTITNAFLRTTPADSGVPGQNAVAEAALVKILSTGFAQSSH